MPHRWETMAELGPAAGRAPSFLRRRRPGSGCWRQPSCPGGPVDGERAVPGPVPAPASSLTVSAAGQGLGLPRGGGSAPLRSPGTGGDCGGRTELSHARSPLGPASDAFGASLSQRDGCPTSPRPPRAFARAALVRAGRWNKSPGAVAACPRRFRQQEDACRGADALLPAPSSVLAG